MAAIWIMPVLFVSEVFMWITNMAVNNTASNARKVICPRAKDVFSVWNICKISAYGLCMKSTDFSAY